MLDNQRYQGDFADQQIMAGTPVYDVNGDKVGEVSSIGQMRNALVVQKGFFFPKDLYIPLSAISGRKDDGVYLNLTKSDINSQEWDKPPTDAMTDATTGMAGSANPEADFGTVRREQLDVEGAPDEIIGSERTTLPDETASDMSGDALDYDPLERREPGLDENPLP